MLCSVYLVEFILNTNSMIEIVPELWPFGHCSSPMLAFLCKNWTISFNQSINQVTGWLSQFSPFFFYQTNLAFLCRNLDYKPYSIHQFFTKMKGIFVQCFSARKYLEIILQISCHFHKYTEDVALLNCKVNFNICLFPYLYSILILRMLYIKVAQFSLLHNKRN